MVRRFRRVAAGLACAVLWWAPASADTLKLTIQPIQVCSSDGLACANPERSLFADITRAIWLQADIWFTALGWQTVYASSLLNASFAEISALGQGAQAPHVLNVWFVNEITDCGGIPQPYGCGFVGGNGLAVANAVFSGGRADVLAHELGHNLGLGHVLDPFNLMAYGDLRVVPSWAGDVYPAGSLARLEPGQIAAARASSQLVPIPEPMSLVLVLSGGGSLLVASRFRRLAARRRSGARQSGCLRRGAGGRPPSCKSRGG